MTKPKNRVYCPVIQRSKMLFDTKERAERFIKFNEPDLKENGTVKIQKLRAYYCEVCGGWHITHALLSKEEAERRDGLVKDIISKATENLRRKQNHIPDEKEIKDEYEFIKGFDLKSFGSKKKFRRYLNDNPDLIPKHLKISDIFHIIKEMSSDYFTNDEQPKSLSEEEISEMAKKLYSELPLQNLTDSAMIDGYIRWEYMFNRKMPLPVINKLRKLCGLQ